MLEEHLLQDIPLHSSSQNDTANVLKVVSLVFYLRLCSIPSKGGSDVETLDAILHTVKTA